MEISTLSLASSSFYNSYQYRRPTTSSSVLASSGSSIFNPNFTVLHKKVSALKNPVVKRRRGLSCTCLFGLGVPELVVIAGVAVLLFGPKQLPGVGRSIGKTVKSFQQAAKEFETELKKEPDTITEPPPNQTASVTEVQTQDDKVSSSKDSS